jgi:hypothetical protein
MLILAVALAGYLLGRRRVREVDLRFGVERLCANEVVGLKASNEGVSNLDDR